MNRFRLLTSSVLLSLSAFVAAQGEEAGGKSKPGAKPAAAKPDAGKPSAAGAERKAAANLPPAPEVAKNAYDVALQLAHKEFAGFTYKLNGDAKKKQTDCTQFLAAVVAAALGKDKLDEAAMDALLIRKVPADALAAAIVDRKPEIRGVQSAVVDVLKVGKAVAPKDLAPGDLVQYWFNRADKWSGHSGVVAAVEKADDKAVKLTLFGAHSSKKGIAMLEQSLILQAEGNGQKTATRLFAVRIDADKLQARKM